MGRWLRHAPSAITLGGLFIAFVSIVASIEGRYEVAAWLVFAATIADIFDGALARGLDLSTAVGRQLDSLTDLVTAGVAPAVLVYVVYFADLGWLGVVCSTVWVAAVALRLARFDTTPQTDAHHFVGIPCPIAGTGVAHYVVFSRAAFGTDGHAVVAAGLIVYLAVLMLSRVPYWKSSTLLPGQFLRHPYGPGAVATILVALVYPGQALFLSVMISVTGALVLYALRPVRARTAPAA